MVEVLIEALPFASWSTTHPCWRCMWFMLWSFLSCAEGRSGWKAQGWKLYVWSSPPESATSSSLRGIRSKLRSFFSSKAACKTCWRWKFKLSCSARCLLGSSSRSVLEEDLEANFCSCSSLSSGRKPITCDKLPVKQWDKPCCDGLSSTDVFPCAQAGLCLLQGWQGNAEDHVLHASSSYPLSCCLSQAKVSQHLLLQMWLPSSTSTLKMNFPQAIGCYCFSCCCCKL